MVALVSVPKWVTAMNSLQLTPLACRTSNCRRLIILMSTCVSLSDTPGIGGILCIVVWTITNGVLEVSGYGARVCPCQY